MDDGTGTGHRLAAKRMLKPRFSLQNFMLNSHELLGFMSPALATDILQFTFDSDKPAYKATLSAVAQAKHVRPIFLERQPRDARHASMLAALTKPALDAGPPPRLHARFARAGLATGQAGIRTWQ